MTALIDPRTLFRDSGFPDQEQQQPGLTGETTPAPDHGEHSYTGHGRLKGRRALITGGDSGIGRAVAIAYAREGAKVAISYLPEEEDDAQETARLINEAGETGLLLPGDLRNEHYCAEIVHATVAAFGGLDLLVLNAAYQRDRTSVGETPRPTKSVESSQPTSRRPSTRSAPPSPTCRPAHPSSSRPPCRATSPARGSSTTP